MTLEKALLELAEKATTQRDEIQNEEAAKQALVLPFIRALGYDVFDLSEVKPEFTADFGSAVLKKADYAIMHNGKPAILFECKQITATLEGGPHSQLMGYFAATPARIGILTNGIMYKFFSDLDEPNKMDEAPFFELDLMNVGERSIENLVRFTKEAFDTDDTIAAASVLKYTGGMKEVLGEQLNNPDDGFVYWLVKKVYPGTLNQKARDRFTPLVGRAFREFIKDRVNLTLKTALNHDSDERDTLDDDSIHQEEFVEDNHGVVTTLLEVEAYAIVKGLLGTVVDISRITIDDKKTFCNILLDAKTQKRICRLHFNNESNLRLGVFDKDKKETRHKIDSPDRIYDHTDAIIARTQLYLDEETAPKATAFSNEPASSLEKTP